MFGIYFTGITYSRGVFETFDNLCSSRGQKRIQSRLTIHPVCQLPRSHAGVASESSPRNGITPDSIKRCCTRPLIIRHLWPFEIPHPTRRAQRGQSVVVSVEEWIEIRRLVDEGPSVEVIPALPRPREHRSRGLHPFLVLLHVERRGDDRERAGRQEEEPGDEPQRRGRLRLLRRGEEHP